MLRAGRSWGLLLMLSKLGLCLVTLDLKLLPVSVFLPAAIFVGGGLSLTKLQGAWSAGARVRCIFVPSGSIE